MLLDEVDITVQAGHGGAGKSSFGGNGPDGGSGGKGGDVYLMVTSDLKALNQFSVKKTITAPNGDPGARNRMDGKKARDIEISLPIGSVLTNEVTGEIVELTEAGDSILICKGGLGGLGNSEFKSGKRRSPTYAQPGLPGEVKKFHVVLKYLADFGLIGLPNAGKSSLLNMLTNAHAVVGAYPFTTLEANLGVINQKIIADIPGLIEGAAQGKGLGIKFLKHIEKVSLLFHCIAADSADCVFDFKTINKELNMFSPLVSAKPQVIIITKIDLVTPEQLKVQKQNLEQFKILIYEASIYNLESIKTLTKLFI